MLFLQRRRGEVNGRSILAEHRADHCGRDKSENRIAYRISANSQSSLKSGIRRQLGFMDEQDATRRYLSDGLPEGLNNELVERVLYYTGQAILFRRYGTAYILPYALDGNIDVYGRFRGVTPLPFRGGVSSSGKKGSKERITPWISGLKLIPVYAGEEIPPNADPESLCVVIRDYIEPGSELITPRYLLMSPLLDCMSDIIPLPEQRCRILPAFRECACTMKGKAVM